MKKLILLLALSKITFAQTISGVVYDASTKQPIPFASVGIKGKTSGTLSNENGVFELPLKNYSETDSLKIASIGYQHLCFAMSKARAFNNQTIYLKQSLQMLSEVVVKPKKIVTKILGNKNYNKNIHCSFGSVEGNYKGVEVAIKANNKKGRLVWIENFNFYINQLAISDSVAFRLNFYKENANGLPGDNILHQPILFKILPQLGVFSIDLKKYSISYDDDFFISLECLSGLKDDKKLSFSGGITGPTYFKVATFSGWEKTPIPGLDFNVKVSYSK